MDIPQFRTNFPEFSDTVVYPTSLISFWASIAETQVSLNAWTTMWANGVALYVAHEITLAAQNHKSGQIGGMPGINGGVPNNKTVGSVSVGYDSATTSEKDAGYWNLTNYGRQFIRLARIFGAGCVQL
jgi:hypothetical protein